MSEHEFYAKKIVWLMERASARTLRRVYYILIKLIELEDRI